MRASRAAVGLVLLAASGCGARIGGYAGSQRTVPIEDVAVGDTMADVRRTLGEPGGVALDATREGRERVVWYYPGGSVERSRTIDSTGSGLYRITFVDGRVVEIRPP